MISSKAHLIRYIRSQLGEPTIQIELTDIQIATVVDDVVEMYTDVVYGDYEEAAVIPAAKFGMDGTAKLPQFSEVLKVGKIGKLKEYNDKQDLHFHWNSISRKLTVSKLGNLSEVAVIGLTKYRAIDEDDHIFNETWVKAMAKAKTKQLWGHVVGKYSQSLVGGATINFDRLISEAETEIERLMEELHDKWVDPAPVMVV